MSVMNKMRDKVPLLSDPQGRVRLTGLTKTSTSLDDSEVDETYSHYKVIHWTVLISYYYYYYIKLGFFFFCKSVASKRRKCLY